MGRMRRMAGTSQMTWAPHTPEGFISAATPPIIRKIVPRRFGTHFFVPALQNEETKDKALLCLSRDMPGVITAHCSTLISRAECENNAATLYERVIIPMTEALDNRVGKRVA